MVLIVLFFMIEGPFIFIDALISSYEILPPDQFFNPHFFLHSSGFWGYQMKLFGKVMDLSIQLATPALIIILMTDTFLGIANRLAPQVQITFLGMPLKSLLALAVVCFGWKQLTGEQMKELHMWLNDIKNVILMLKPA
jgi:type III secretion protein T